jgi:Zn-dependent protease with chaperone function
MEDALTQAVATPAQDVATAPAQRLNPFLFPTDTNMRFALLIVAVLSAGLLVFQSLSNAASRAMFHAFALNCGFTKACWQPYEIRQAAWMALGTLGVMAAGVLLYWLVPAWKIRRDRLAPITREDDAALFDYLQQLAREAGLTRTPIFVWNPLDPRVGGQAFGRLGRYFVALTGGLATRFYNDRLAMRAVLLHELAHLRNKDVDRTYLALTITAAFFALAFAPFVLSLLAEADTAFALSTLWRGMALALLVYLTCNAILRAREYYADLRAATWDGTDANVARVISGMPRSTRSVWRLQLTHPDPHQRLAVLQSPDRLFHAGFWEAAAAGLAIGAAFANVAAWLALALPAAQELLAYPLAALVFGSLLAIMLGVNVWRAAFGQAQLGGAWHVFVIFALGAGLGLFAGRLLLFRSTASDITANVQAGIATLLILVMLAFVGWLSVCAAIWLRAVHSEHGLHVTMAGVLIVAAILLVALLGAAFFVADNFAPWMDVPAQVFEGFNKVMRRLNLWLPLVGLALVCVAAAFVFRERPDRLP